MNSATTGDSVSFRKMPMGGPPAWAGTVRQIDGAKALVGVSDIALGCNLVRRVVPPVLVWVDVENIEHHENPRP